MDARGRLQQRFGAHAATLELMCETFVPVPAVEYLSALYHGGIHEIRESVADTLAEVQTVLVLGHNPGWQHAVAWLSGQHEVMSTANAALLQSEGDTWREVMHGEGTWQLLDVIRPKEIQAAE